MKLLSQQPPCARTHACTTTTCTHADLAKIAEISHATPDTKLGPQEPSTCYWFPLMHTFDHKHQNSEWPETAACFGVLLRIVGAGDRDRTGDIQLGKLMAMLRSTQNQAFRAGLEGQNAALAALTEHTIEHNCSRFASPHHDPTKRTVPYNHLWISIPTTTPAAPLTADSTYSTFAGCPSKSAHGLRSPFSATLSTLY
jgi:hypothetical protein